MKKTLLLALGLITCIFCSSCRFNEATISCSDEKPNIIFIITDDLGWGDVGCYGSKIATPNIDKLASQGSRFTNAYAPSSTCTPTRYSILTGEYAWRRPPKQTGILDGDAPLAIEPGRETLPSMLSEAGYKTALVGKWHLGLGDGKTAVDFNGKISPGPLETGFDSAYFIPATVDRVPCVFIDGHHVDKLDLADPIKISYLGPVADEPAGRDHPEMLKVVADNQHSDVVINGISRIGYMTGGEKARWTDEDIADTITGKAVEFIEANKDQPFFLMLGTHDPHVPRAPHPRFVGKSGYGVRGDTVVEIDWVVGEVMKTLDRTGLADNTLVFFTSDNGPVLFDGYFDGSLEDVKDHKPAGGLHGWKYLVYEGGCRVPFIVRWPGKIEPEVNDNMFCLVDMLATVASITGLVYDSATAGDSMDLSATLLGQAGSGPVRESVVQHGISDTLSIRKGDWKFIPSNAERKTTGIGRGANPKDKRFVEAKVYEDALYDLATDPAESKNVIEDYPAKAAELKALLEKVKEGSSE